MKESIDCSTNSQDTCNCSHEPKKDSSTYNEQEELESNIDYDNEETNKLMLPEKSPHDYRPEVNKIESNNEDILSQPQPELGNKKDVDENLIASIQNQLLKLTDEITELENSLEDQKETSSRRLSEVNERLQNKTEEEDFISVKNEFNLFSKRLRRVAKEADASHNEVLDASKIPPDVLEIAYKKTLNNIFTELVTFVGEKDAHDIVFKVIKKVRSSSAGVDFFRFETGRFTVYKLAEAIENKLVSPKQIHATYLELVRNLMEYIPGYETRDFKSFVETGSMEYVIDKVRLHEDLYVDILEKMNYFEDIADKISEQMENISNKQEELENNIQEINHKSSENSSFEEEGANQVAHAINIHTKTLKKLSENIKAIEKEIETQKSDNKDEINELQFQLNTLKENQMKKGREELQELLEEQLNSVNNKIDVAIKSNNNKIESDLSQLNEEVISIKDELGLLKEHFSTELSLFDKNVLKCIEEENSGMTLKQIKKKLPSNDVDENVLEKILEKLLETEYIEKYKKGRYVYYTRSKN
ncbi:hypothetical protein [Methanosalsum natronophilum]|uniref:hypothetical protein n=1 Tax=Methanosalsum natronophilum TaxID=768733 RepID=UPI002168905E|nr:hypothetical protein [Methanosalsum natronophilum]MCS3922981.1 chromosome segregation ATPase [Methanosalsum natronophilum]